MREAVLRYPLYKIEIDPDPEKSNTEISVKRAEDLLPISDICQAALPFLVGAVASYTRLWDDAFIGNVDFLFRSSDGETSMPICEEDRTRTIFYEYDLQAFNACFRGNIRIDKIKEDQPRRVMKSDDTELERALANLCTSAWMAMNSIERSTQVNEELRTRLAMMKQYLVEAEQLLAKEKV